MLNPSLVLNLVILCGILSIIFAYITGVQILSASSGNARMKEIAGAIQIGARAYLNLFLHFCVTYSYSIKLHIFNI